MLLVIHAQIAFRQGRYEDALATYREALEVATRAAGPDGPATAEPLGDIAVTLTHVGKTSEALGYSDRAVAIAERDFPSDHPFLGMQYDLRSGILETVGRHEDARRDARRALAVIEKNFGPESVLAVPSLATLGSTSVAAGDVKGGLATLERAALLCSGPECAKLTRAGLDFELAKALRLAGQQPKRALALADEAEALYRELGDPMAETARPRRTGR
jgi:tetratricopeptide (TPR) repeat protein